VRVGRRLASRRLALEVIALPLGLHGGGLPGSETRVEVVARAFPGGVVGGELRVGREGHHPRPDRLHGDVGHGRHEAEGLAAA